MVWPRMQEMRKKGKLRLQSDFFTPRRIEMRKERGKGRLRSRGVASVVLNIWSLKLQRYSQHYDIFLLH